MTTQFAKTPEGYWLDGNGTSSKAQIVIERTVEGKRYIPLGITFEKADFLDAVRTELNVIIIDQAEYLDANPPVDEAQVEALAQIVRDEESDRRAAGDQASWEDIARRLVERGVRVEVAS